MDKSLVEKLTAILLERPAYWGWDIEVLSITPNMRGLQVRFKQKGAIQSIAATIRYDRLVG